MPSQCIYTTTTYSQYENRFKSVRKWRVDCVYEPFVYIIKEISTNKFYIGSKIRQNCLESDLGTTYFTSSSKFNWRLNPDSFIVETVIPCASNHDAMILEYLLIKEHNAVKSNLYYNVSHPYIGFNGGSSLGMTGKNHSDDTLVKMSEAKQGKKLTQSTKQKISEATKGNKNARFGVSISDDTLVKMSEAKQGKKLTQSTKQKMSYSGKRKEKIECVHCRRFIDPGNYSKYHGNKCRKNPNIDPAVLEERSIKAKDHAKRYIKKIS